MSLNSRHDALALSERRILKILNVIGTASGLTQRSLAAELGVALGTAHNLVQKAVANEWVEVLMRGRRAQYYLTPAGLRERLRLSRRRFETDINNYAGLRNQIVSQLQKIDTSRRRLVFYGAGDLAQIALIAIMNGDFELIGVVDDQLHGKQFCGRLVHGPEVLEDGKLNGNQFDTLIIIPQHHRSSISRILKNLKAKSVEVFYLMK